MVAEAPEPVLCVPLISSRGPEVDATLPALVSDRRRRRPPWLQLSAVVARADVGHTVLIAVPLGERGSSAIHLPLGPKIRLAYS